MDKNLLSHRANINKQYATGKDVFIYEDHRTILNILFAHKINTEVQFPINIILFDNHDDGCSLDKSVLKTITKFNKTTSLRDFWSFTEFDLSGMDDDWVKAGMELNLIKNIFLFNSPDSGIPAGYRDRRILLSCLHR